MLCNPGYAITNGEPDAGRHPYVCLVVFEVYVPGSGNVPAWRCSGSLIAPDVVLTAGACTDGAAGARVWFAEDVEQDPHYPNAGTNSIEGEPFTHPGYCIGCGDSQGLPGYFQRDVGVVILDEPVDAGSYASLPDEGLADSLKSKTALDVVGYGYQEKTTGGGLPVWTGDKVRLYAPSQLVPGKFAWSDESLRISLNLGGGKGGFCYGDSGGPTLLGDTDTILGINSHTTNRNCAGVGYSSRIDISEVLEWVYSYVDKTLPPIALCGADLVSGNLPLTVYFSAEGSYDPDGGDIVLYEWDFDGDGTYDFSRLTPESAAHTYQAPGTFNATLRVTDDEADTDSCTVAITVNSD
jgi:hypothetical protein